MQVDDANAEGESVATINELIIVEDSSPEPTTYKKKSRGASAKKIPAIPRMTPTHKVKKVNKVPTGKAVKTADATRRLASNESANSNPNADTLKLNPLFFILLNFFI